MSEMEGEGARMCPHELAVSTRACACAYECTCARVCVCVGGGSHVFPSACLAVCE
jgi:hypothetical protein